MNGFITLLTLLLLPVFGVWADSSYAPPGGGSLATGGTVSGNLTVTGSTAVGNLVSSGSVMASSMDSTGTVVASNQMTTGGFVADYLGNMTGSQIYAMGSGTHQIGDVVIRADKIAAKSGGLILGGAGTQPIQFVDGNGNLLAYFSTDGQFSILEVLYPNGVDAGGSGYGLARSDVGNGGNIVDWSGNFYATTYSIPHHTYTAAGTTGAQTINQGAGIIRIAAGQSSVTLTNSLVTALSGTAGTAIFATIQSHDATATSVQAVALSGSATFYLNAPAAAEVPVYWELRN